MSSSNRHFLAPLAALTALCASGLATANSYDDHYKQTNLVSDGAVPALKTDPNLKNPWGVAAVPGGAFWFSDNANGLSTLYDGLGNVIPLVVTVPPPKGSATNVTAAPSGIVWNPNTGNFLLGPQQPAIFIFSTEDGTISAWNPTTDLHNAVLEVDNSAGGTGAVYKGLAVATNAQGTYLYATNFRGGTVDVFDAKFQPAKLAGSFADPSLPAGYAPFGIAAIDGNLFVTYALQDAAKHDDQKGPGHGFVNIFDTDGRLIRRFASRGALNSPWGVARAPYGFGAFSSQILVGNFGSGEIDGFTADGEFSGSLHDSRGAPIKIDGLWSIVFGSETATEPETLYFTAGPNAEADGLFGSVKLLPSTSSASNSPP